jgi:hypothetical protein
LQSISDPSQEASPQKAANARQASPTPFAKKVCYMSDEVEKTSPSFA